MRMRGLWQNAPCHITTRCCVIIVIRSCVNCWSSSVPHLQTKLAWTVHTTTRFQIADIAWVSGFTKPLSNRSNQSDSNLAQLGRSLKTRKNALLLIIWQKWCMAVPECVLRICRVRFPKQFLWIFMQTVIMHPAAAQRVCVKFPPLQMLQLQQKYGYGSSSSAD